MLKTVVKILFLLLLLFMSIFFYFNEQTHNTNSVYKQILLEDNNEYLETVAYLEKNKDIDFISIDNFKIPINTYVDISEKDINEIKEKIDKRDYRYTPYIDSVERLFKIDGKDIVYVNLNNYSLIKQLVFYYKMYNQNIEFKVLDLELYRNVVNTIVFMLILIIFSLGSKTRTILSILACIAFIFIPGSENNFLFITSFYLLCIIVIESLSLSNAYIKRNNLGFIRMILFIVLVVFPSFFPLLYKLDEEVLNPVFIDKEISYKTMEQNFDKDMPDISNFFTHYAYQKSVLYGSKYLFPSYSSSVNLNEFKRAGHSLESNIVTVVKHDDIFLEGFRSILKSTPSGKYYSSFNGSFYFEIRSLSSLYIREKEYMQICILAVIMLISFLLFKKKGSKILKYR